MSLDALKELKRWLKPEEVLEILKAAQSGSIQRLAAIYRLQIVSKLPLRPKVTSVFLIDTKGSKEWKRDAYNYEARSNGRGFKELCKHVGSHQNLKCLYSTIDLADPVYDLTKDQGTCLDFDLRCLLHELDELNHPYIQRRIYQLKSDKNDPANDFRVVQYFFKPS